MKLRAWAAPAAAVMMSATLAGCGSLTPGTAAVVGDQKITMAQVDELVDAQCTGAEAAKGQGQSQAQPVSDIKRRSLGLLIDTSLSQQYAESKDAVATPEVTKLIFGSYEQALATYPAGAREPLSDALRDLAESQSALVSVAARERGETVSTTNVESLLNAGIEGRRAWQKKIEIDTDARFSPDKSGFPATGDGSVSKAASSFAKDGVAKEVSPAWVDQLPASQKCG